MKLWINNRYQTTGRLPNQVNEVLLEHHLDGFAYSTRGVEIFSSSWLCFGDELPSDYQLVDYGSRDTILICIDGVVHTDEEWIRKYEEENLC